MSQTSRRAAGRASSTPFSSFGARRVLVEACATVGLDATDAELIRLGENAIFRLSGEPIVVRVARGGHLLHVAEKEVAVSLWLEDEGIPVARVVHEIAQPVVSDGHPVTFWRYIERGDGEPTYRELGEVLRRLHGLTSSVPFPLPAHDVFARTARRIEAARGIEDADREFLLGREVELRERCAALTFPSPPAPIHGDAHVENLMRNPDGEVVLIDFENFAIGHREWDLVVTGAEYESAHWISEEQYRDFVAGYGRDITDWAGYPVLRDIQEFKMTTWLMQNIHEGPEIAEEFARRLASIRDDTSRRGWRPY